MMRWIVPILVVALAGAAAYYLLVYRGATVEVAKATRGPAVEAVYATGVVEPVTWAKVAPQVSARILDLCRCEGQAVAAGFVLAELDGREARANLAELEARTDFLTAEAKRYSDLLAKRVVSVQAYEQVTSNLAQARAAVAAARRRLDNFTVRAPIDGVVLRRDGEIGEIATPNDVLFWIGPRRPLWIVAEVDEEDIPRVREGQRALIRADAFPDHALSGTVAEITPKGDPVAKNFRVRIQLPDDTPLLIGMNAEINIIIRQAEDAVLVPREAISNGRVWTIEDGKAAPRPVSTGIIGDTRVQILSGLKSGERVIVSPPDALTPGERVQVTGAP